MTYRWKKFPPLLCVPFLHPITLALYFNNASQTASALIWAVFYPYPIPTPYLLYYRLLQSHLLEICIFALAYKFGTSPAHTLAYTPHPHVNDNHSHSHPCHSLNSRLTWPCSAACHRLYLSILDSSLKEPLLSCVVKIQHISNGIDHDGICGWMDRRVLWTGVWRQTHNTN